MKFSRASKSNDFFEDAGDIRSPSKLKIKNAILVNDFDDAGVLSFKHDFDILMGGYLPVITVVIDSFGGEIYSLLAMLDILATADRPVATVAVGKAMSCGSILLACGTPGYRFASQNSTIMVHDAATFSFGKIEDLKADVGEAERLNNLIFEILNSRCGKKNDYFQKVVSEKKHANWYLTAEEAVSHGIVDGIGMPTAEAFATGVQQPIVAAKKAPAKQPVKKAAKKKK